MNLIDVGKLMLTGKHEDFDVVDTEAELKEGDLILRNMDFNKSPFYHAGVYCGEEEVIDFAGQSDSPQPTQGIMSCCSSSCMSGKVSKVGLKIFIREKTFQILRLKSGISAGFRQRIKKAMNATIQYDAKNFNCLHFALGLMGKIKVPEIDYETAVKKNK